MRIAELMQAKCLEQCLARSKPSVNVGYYFPESWFLLQKFMLRLFYNVGFILSGILKPTNKKITAFKKIALVVWI